MRRTGAGAENDGTIGTRGATGAVFIDGSNADRAADGAIIGADGAENDGTDG